MGLPEFTAEVSLGRSRGKYYTPMLGASGNRAAIQPQAQCWCSEPDTRTVCTGSGASRHCHEKPVCLQWFCPGRGTDVDPEDFFG
jgi:hypothetical protein